MPKRVLGVLGGGDFPADLLRKWALSAEIMIAADSGANRLQELNLTPNVIVGDMDSVSPDLLNSGAEIYRDESQTYTDCDKLLRLAGERSSFPLTLVSIEGNRVDHMLGALHSVAQLQNREQVTLGFRRSLGWIAGPGLSRKPAARGRRVSLIPLIRSTGVCSKGLKWPLENATLEAGGFASISNVCDEDSFTIRFEAGLILIVAEHAVEEFPIW